MDNSNFLGKMPFSKFSKHLHEGVQILWQSTGAEYSLFPAIIYGLKYG